MSLLTRSEAEEVVGSGLWLAREPAEIRAGLLAVAALVHVPRGTRIYDPAGGPAGLVGIADGQVRLEIASGPDDPGLFALATPGFVLADLPPPEGLPSAVTAMAGRDCTLLVVPPRRLARLAASMAGFDAAMVRLVTLNLWTTLAIVSALRRQSNASRVAALLITLAGADLRDGWRIDVPQADLAAMAAIGRTALIEALRDLESLGLVETRYRAIHLSNVAGLVALRDGVADRGSVPAIARAR